MESPWSIGTRVLTLLPGWDLDGLLDTKMLHSFLSMLRIRKSKIAILCTSSAEKSDGEKFSIGPSFWIKA